MAKNVEQQQVAADLVSNEALNSGLFCQTPHKLMNRVTATLTLTLTLTLTDTGGPVVTLMLGYRSPQSSE